jgi:hypothetical protein
MPTFEAKSERSGTLKQLNVFSLGMKNKELKGISYMIINFERHSLDIMLPLIKVPNSKLF